MNVQVIERDGQPAFAVLPYEEYTHLLEELEELREVAAYDAAKARREEGFPDQEVVNRVLAGESPLRVFREYRGLTQAALAEACGITAAAISQVESGKRAVSVETLRRISHALDVDAELLWGE